MRNIRTVMLCICAIFLSLVTLTESRIKDIKIHDDTQKPKTSITILPQVKVNTLTFKFLCSQYPLNGETPHIVVQTEQTINKSAMGMTVERYFDAINLKLEPRIEEFKINNKGVTSKFEIFSWIEHIPTLNNEVTSGITTRKVYPSFSLMYPSDSLSERGEIEGKFTLHNCDTIYQVKRNSFWFPFEKRIMKLGFTNTEGILEVVFLGSYPLTTYVNSFVLESVYPNKILKTLDGMTGNKGLTAVIEVPRNLIIFFDVSLGRKIYEQMLFLFLYLGGVITVVLARDRELIIGCSWGILQFLFGLFAFGKESFALIDILFVSIIVLLIFAKHISRRRLKGSVQF